MGMACLSGKVQVVFPSASCNLYLPLSAHDPRVIDKARYQPGAQLMRVEVHVPTGTDCTEK